MADRRGPWPWLAAALAVLAVVAALSYDRNPLISVAQGYAEDVAKASAATYVSLRTLNAFLSFAQEIEVGGSLVVSGTARPLKVLEPIDDTIERIASVVFVVMLATGVLSVALGPVSGTGWGLVALAAVLWAWRGRARGGAAARKLGVYGAFLGLALPLAFLLASVLAERMTARVWAEHQAVVAEMTEGVDGSDLPAPGDGGFWRELQDRLGGADRYQAMAASLYTHADDLIASYIAILAVFIFRIFVLPVMLVGAFMVLARHLSRMS
ncbi:MAG: hypothetical protein NXH82_16805 [Rhodobacteraceae bacterium]|nr:hypothetical protein [Paracoccaceae bacterium]